MPNIMAIETCLSHSLNNFGNACSLATCNLVYLMHVYFMTVGVVV